MNLKPVNFNEECNCGSGQAFGICCGKDLLRWSHEQSLQAKFPSPRPLSANLGDQKLRFVGSQIIVCQPDEHIQEYIIYALIRSLGEKWYEHQVPQSDADCHVITQWIRTRYEFLKQIEPFNLNVKDHVVSSPGEVMALLSLAADWYCLQSEGQLPKALIKRLRNLDQFQGARYEITVAASLIRAGFKIDWIKEHPSAKTCEFNATHKVTKETIAIEAKSRQRPGTLNRLGDIPLFKEIKADIFGLYNDAIGHDPGDKPFGVFIDLNVPLQANRSFFSKDWVTDLLQRIRQKGKAVFGPKPPSFLAITNCSWHYDGKSPTKWPENLGILPPDAKYSFKNPLTIEALGYSLNMFGELPDEK